MARPTFLVAVLLAGAASAALAQGPGSRLLIGSPPLRPVPPRVEEAKPERKAFDATACDRMRGAARGRCLLEARELATGESSVGPASAGAGSAAGSGASSGTTGGAGAGGSAPH